MAGMNWSANTMTAAYTIQNAARPACKSVSVTPLTRYPTDRHRSASKNQLVRKYHWMPKMIGEQLNSAVDTKLPCQLL